MIDEWEPQWQVMFVDGHLEGKIIAVEPGTETYTSPVPQPRAMRQRDSFKIEEQTFEYVHYTISEAFYVQDLGRRMRRGESMDLYCHHYFRVGYLSKESSLNKYRGVIHFRRSAWADGEPYYFGE